MYVIGSAFAAAGITMGTMPFFAVLTPILVAKICAALGAVILAVGRFAPDHVLKRILLWQR
jgi:formaldehyde-activating enzyme involved in methanogenesis